MECPELGGEGEARVEDVMEVGMKPRPVLSLPREEGGMGGLSKATLTRLSISSARSSVFSFSSWINLGFQGNKHVDNIRTQKRAPEVSWSSKQIRTVLKKKK